MQVHEALLVARHMSGQQSHPETGRAQSLCNRFLETAPRTAAKEHSGARIAPVLYELLSSATLLSNLRGWREQSRRGSSPPSAPPSNPLQSLDSEASSSRGPSPAPDTLFVGPCVMFVQRAMRPGTWGPTP